MKKYIKELIPYIVILVVVVLIRTFLVTPVIVSGESMIPTLKDGNLMILNKRAKLKRFDIVVIDTGKEEIIKRIIGMPGETISCEDGVWYIDGVKQEDDYSTEYCTSSRETKFEKVELEDDEYFCMGDNRMNSKDSRYYGPFTRKQIKGRVRIRLFPFNKFGKVE